MKEDPKEKALVFEKFDLQHEIITKLFVLVDASWDSNTVKSQIEKLLKDYDKIAHELFLYQEKKPTPKN